MDLDQRLPAGIRVMLLFLSLLYLASLVFGIAYAFGGSQSDVSKNEQLAALICGIGMIASGVVGLDAAAKVKPQSSLRVALICAAGAIISFLLAMVFGP